ncbi:hypothetical protein BLOT_007329 [Blomia tropicalis]|nr:hypothetical protein BLOT_007329 [Blomia tropicalis]
MNGFFGDNVTFKDIDFFKKTLLRTVVFIHLDIQLNTINRNATNCMAIKKKHTKFIEKIGVTVVRCSGGRCERIQPIG